MLTRCYSTDCCAITPDLHPQEKAAGWCWIPLIIISQTGFRPEQSWRTTEALLDYNLRITKQTGLWTTFASCYHQVLSAWLQVQVYRDLAGASGSFASSSPTRPGRQLGLYLKVRAVRELGRLHAEVNMSFYHLPEKPWVVTLPSGLPLLVCMGMCGGTQGGLGQAGHFSYPTSPPENIRPDVGLRNTR